MLVRRINQNELKSNEIREEDMLISTNKIFLTTEINDETDNFLQSIVNKNSNCMTTSEVAKIEKTKNNKINNKLNKLNKLSKANICTNDTQQKLIFNHANQFYGVKEKLNNNNCNTNNNKYGSGESIKKFFTKIHDRCNSNKTKYLKKKYK